MIKRSTIKDAFGGEVPFTKFIAWFTHNPQNFADWVREHHSFQVYNNRRKTKKDVIV
jgi:hypothetical protein